MEQNPHVSPPAGEIETELLEIEHPAEVNLKGDEKTMDMGLIALVGKVYQQSELMLKHHWIQGEEHGRLVDQMRKNLLAAYNTKDRVNITKGIIKLYLANNLGNIQKGQMVFVRDVSKQMKELYEEYSDGSTAITKYLADLKSAPVKDRFGITAEFLKGF